MKKEITKNTKLSEIVQKNEKAAEILFREGLMCIGCPMAMEETLEQGANAHGMSEKQIDAIVKKINK